MSDLLVRKAPSLGLPSQPTLRSIASNSSLKPGTCNGHLINAYGCVLVHARRFAHRLQRGPPRKFMYKVYFLYTFLPNAYLVPEEDPPNANEHIM